MDIILIIFVAVSLVTVASAAVVAFSRNIIYSAFALLGVFAGVLGLYIMLSADFVAIIQLIVYIGGILVLILFAVMFTTKVETAAGQRKLVNRAMTPFAALIGTAAFGAFIWRAILKIPLDPPFTKGENILTTFAKGENVFPPFVKGGEGGFISTTALIGDKLLQEYLLPFEIISLLLVLVLVGAVVLARREVK